MHRARVSTVIVPAILALGLSASPAPAQDHTVADPVIQAITEEGLERSRLESMARALLDSIGPRLAGTPEYDAAADWVAGRYREWGIEVRMDSVGTWRGWEQGFTHVDLIAPRRRTLEAVPMAYSPGTGGVVEGRVVTIPASLAEDEVESWLADLEGAFVLAMPPEPMCRARQELEANAREETVAKIDSLRQAERTAWGDRLEALGSRNPWTALARVADAGVAGIVMGWWSEGWGANKIFDAPTREVPSFSLSCEDYGLLYRLAEDGSAPRIRVEMTAELKGEVPHDNVIAEIRGSDLPDEYVVLSAHLDSWHAASGATDNGTGTLMVLEAMRLLKAAGLTPRRTIIAGHWAAEEVGHIGSRAFTEDHPEVLEGLQATFNQDNGTWRIEKIEGQGFLYAGERIARWIAQVPRDIASGIELEFPGTQYSRGSDHINFTCAGAPGFRLQSPYDEYRQYTWHTERDTYDKIVFDDLRDNAILAAILAYAAAEDPVRTPRDRALLPIDERTGEPGAWPECR
ncbi:MAG: M20/M25/M40 family metallo-hydrolase, partial [marine benthic group bacterium]|nr:M20/M25/M40 family metallo-hydrolase [Gemmatimonadota bacterium]MCL7980372.1 M20/M25/M40 family metallo-hydrolase [Gemmatimonadota bacterium]